LKLCQRIEPPSPILHLQSKQLPSCPLASTRRPKRPCPSMHATITLFSSRSNGGPRLLPRDFAALALIEDGSGTSAEYRLLGSLPLRKIAPIAASEFHKLPQVPFMERSSRIEAVRLLASIETTPHERGTAHSPRAAALARPKHQNNAVLHRLLRKPSHWPKVMGAEAASPLCRTCLPSRPGPRRARTTGGDRVIVATCRLGSRIIKLVQRKSV
jgi:hypothetical protein